ncbi:unnamed protein product [Cuscuta campestris]|uniref:Uncharacterized protein n=1 Tax=Cuscuta campestris TaxID=132261 RepID=A0A484L458_9ASTE|nr:unnamed protein product [Cuscuta campestris]
MAAMVIRSKQTARWRRRAPACPPIDGVQRSEASGILWRRRDLEPAVKKSVGGLTGDRLPVRLSTATWNPTAFGKIFSGVSGLAGGRRSVLLLDKFGYDDWKIMMEAHLYALHDCMWMVLEDGPLKIQMENPERNPANLGVVQYIPKPKEKWDDRDCKKHNLDNVAKAAIFKTLDLITFSKIKHLKTAMEI